MMKSNMDSLVTISIPIYNAERFLRDAILSVINQTYKDWTIRLINDGSTDNSLIIMQEFAARDPRIKIIDDGLNKGLITRLNQSIDLTDTKYYARMDADDIMYVTRIEEQIKLLEEHKDIDVCGASIMLIDANNKIVGSGYYEGNVSSFVHPSVMGKTTWFKKNIYAEWAVRAEDCELWLRTTISSNFYSIGKPLLFYREYGVPTFYKYYITQKTLLKIYTKYKTYGKNFMWYIQNTVLTISKIMIAVICALVGKSDWLISFRRRKTIPVELCLTSEDLLHSVKNM